MASLREELNREEENRKIQKNRTATDGSIIVKENYTLQDLEEYIINKVHEGKLDFLENNHEKIVKLILEKEDNCFDVNIRPTRLFLSMYLNYYLNNIEPYIFLDKLTDFFYESDCKQLCKDSQEYALILSPVRMKYSYEMMNNSIICRKKDEEIFISKYNNSVENIEFLKQIAIKLFKKPVETIDSFLNGKQITNLKQSLSVSVFAYIEANNINKYRQIKSLLNDELAEFASKEKLINLILVPTDDSPKLIFTRANFLCILSIYVNKNGDLSTGNPEYAVLCKDDHISLRTGEGTSVSMDATISPVYTKKSSVIGSALIGTAIAGVAGGSVGALLATDANRRRQEQIDTYKPLMVEIKLPKLEIKLDMKRMKDTIFLDIEKALFEDKEKERLFSILSEAKSERACFEGELIKEFILDSDANEEYSEEKFTMYSNRRRESLANECFNKNNRFVVITDTEKEIQNKIKNSKDECNKCVNDLEKEYDVKINECKEQVTEIKNKINSLGIFKMKEKKPLKLELQETEKKIDSLEKSCEKDVANLKEKFQKERQSFEVQKNDIMMIKESLLYNVGILEVQNRLY